MCYTYYHILHKSWLLGQVQQKKKPSKTETVVKNFVWAFVMPHVKQVHVQRSLFTLMQNKRRRSVNVTLKVIRSILSRWLWSQEKGRLWASAGISPPPFLYHRCPGLPDPPLLLLLPLRSCHSRSTPRQQRDKVVRSAVERWGRWGCY